MKLEDLLEIEKGGTILMGAVLVLAGPALISAVAGAAKPLAKAAIKGGLIAYDRAKVLTAETVETLQDITAEAKAEIEQKK